MNQATKQVHNIMPTFWSSSHLKFVFILLFVLFLFILKIMQTYGLDSQISRIKLEPSKGSQVDIMKHIAVYYSSIKRGYLHLIKHFKYTSE